MLLVEFLVSIKVKGVGYLIFWVFILGFFRLDNLLLFNKKFYRID